MTMHYAGVNYHKDGDNETFEFKWVSDDGSLREYTCTNSEDARNFLEGYYANQGYKPNICHNSANEMLKIIQRDLNPEYMIFSSIQS